MGIYLVLFVGLAGSYFISTNPRVTASQDKPDKANVLDPNRIDPAQITTELLQSESEYHKGKKDKVQSDKIIEKAMKRKEAMKSIMSSSPETALQLAFSEKARQNLPAEARQYIETEVAVEGTLETINVDDFAGNQSTLLHNLVVGDKRLRMHLAEKERVMQSGVTAKVKGMQIDDEIIVDNRRGKNVELGGKSSRTLGITTPMTKKIAVILVTFQNTSAQPFTPDQARGAVFTDPRSVRTYFNEASFGSWNLAGHTRSDGDVFGWVMVPYDNANCNFMFTTWTNNVDGQLRSQGADLNAYDNRIYIFNNPSGCPGAGWGLINGPVSWIASGLDVRVLAHELGHNYGSHHASTKICKNSAGQRVSISQSCINDEYGDVYDVMGIADYHFNSFNKGVFRWLEGSNTQTATASGTFSIAPLGSNTTAAQTVRIAYPQTAGIYYYLEYRRPFGAFEVFAETSEVANGISVRLAPEYAAGRYTHLLDMNPSTDSFSDAPLPVGRTFTDADSGITITTESVTAAEARVRVTISTANCVRNKPELSIFPLSLFANAGETRLYQFAVTNKDSQACPASNFSVSSSFPGGWVLSPGTVRQTLLPGAGYIGTVRLTSPADAQPGAYTFTEKVVHEGDAGKTVIASANYNINTPASTVTPIAVTPTQPPAVATPTGQAVLSPTPVGPTQVQADKTPPVITFVSPQHGGQVPKKSTVTTTVTATDDTGVGKVEFYVNGKLQCTDDSPSYSCTWTTEPKPNTNYKLQVKAYDLAGNASTGTIQVTSK